MDEDLNSKENNINNVSNSPGAQGYIYYITN